MFELALQIGKILWLAIPVIFMIFSASSSHAQGVTAFTSNPKANLEFRQNTSSVILGSIDTGKYSVCTSLFRWNKVGYQRNDATTTPSASGLVWTDDSGYVMRTKMDDFFTNPNMAALGIMSAQRATDSITNIKAQIAANTANFANYLLISTAASTYQPIGSYATTSALAAKLNITDTTSKWLSPGTALITYQPIGSYATFAALAAKVNITDTATMLTPYRNAINTNAASLLTKLSVTDTVSLSNRINAKGNGTITSVGISSTDFAVSGSPVTTSGNITVNLNTSGITPGSYMGATYNSKGIATVGMNPAIDTLSSARTFNTAYLMSSTKYVDIRVSAQISCALSLTGGQAGTIFLETSPDAATWTQMGQMNNSNQGALTIGLNTTQINGSQVSCLLPPNYYWRARTSNVVGTPTFTMFIGNKITY